MCNTNSLKMVLNCTMYALFTYILTPFSTWFLMSEGALKSYHNQCQKWPSFSVDLPRLILPHRWTPNLVSISVLIQIKLGNTFWRSLRHVFNIGYHSARESHSVQWNIGLCTNIFLCRSFTVMWNGWGLLAKIDHMKVSTNKQLTSKVHFVLFLFNKSFLNTNVCLE